LRHGTQKTLLTGSQMDDFAHTFSIENSVHVIRSAGQEVLRTLGAGKVVTFEDWLAWGPCDQEPETHAMLRRQFWSGRDESLPAPDALDLIQKIEEVNGCGDVPVNAIFWTSNTWSDRLSLLWFMDAAFRHRHFPLNLWMLDVPSSASGRAYERRVRPCGVTLWPIEQLRCESGHARLLSRETIRCGHRLWRLYASRSPLQFDRERRKGFPGLPMLSRVADAHRLLFPRFIRGKVRLSAFDQAILSPLLESATDQWLRASSIVSQLTTSREVERLGSERAVWERFRDWAEGSPVLDARLQPRAGVRDQLCYSYKLTNMGRRILTHGVDTTQGLPVLFSGGCRAYGDSPWVAQTTGRTWRIVRRDV
jgi:hypothetical protein